MRRGKKHDTQKRRIVIEETDRLPVMSRPGAVQPSNRPVAIPPISEAEVLNRTRRPDLSLSGYHPDPTGRHDLRFYNGSVWTANVVDGRAASIDPVASNGKELPAPLAIIGA
jgi:hypothetical protein